MKNLKLFFKNKSFFTNSAFLVGATMLSNFINYVFNAYMGRALSFEDFAKVGLIGSFFYLTSIPFSSLFSAVSFESGFLIGKRGMNSAKSFLAYTRSHALFVSIILTSIWVALTPLTTRYFNLPNPLPVLIFAPVWLVGAFLFINRGFMFGSLMLVSLGLLYLFEPVIKLILSLGFITLGFQHIAYMSLPLSFIIAFLLSELLLKRVKINKQKKQAVFPFKFYFGSVLSTLSAMAFLSIDVLLANHYLAPADAGKYALISLIGKMIYLLGGIFGQFIGPLISKKEGESKNSSTVFYKLVAVTSFFTMLGVLAFGVLSHFTIPFLFGAKAVTILPYLPIYTLATACFTISGLFQYYLLARRVYLPSVIGFLSSLFLIVLISRFHSNISAFVGAITAIGILNLVLMVAFHAGFGYLQIFEKNVKDFLGMFNKMPAEKVKDGALRILVLNWRDTKHLWSGGAEVYIEEVAKQWKKEGHKITIFCGNDGVSKSNETVNGIRVIRRGGFYTVYLWAALYYIFKFRRNYDIVVDSENGIPFFSPLFSSKPVVLLIHHVHQEIFREHLVFPFSQIAQFVEGKLMPSVYRRRTVVTVSNSSKNEIIKAKLARENDIHIVNPGVTSRTNSVKKTTFPSFIYLGRLKAYKNIDTAIRAFAQIEKKYPEAKLWIVGEGELGGVLQSLVAKLGISNKVTFYGKVTDSMKRDLLSKAWVALQPSLMEGWGITVIEANAYKTPVIASDTHGLRDSIVDGKTGLLVPVKNIDLFAKSMEKLVVNAIRREKMSQNAFEWSKKFSWEKSAQNFSSILFSEIDRKASSFSLGRVSSALNRVTSIF